ncbi:MAG: indolepyruvate ferredoxin oxidoreductase family protein [Armatimonadota bacterium]|nr:indolepyruvate ferredoxin oxidoreductase family protein [Armatimonadota bacterium]MDR7445233.1 indolepyruvate ferredoxin oxidoreductase family protein [Armatimonadota bacterium]MDR7571201.1 indolepyruvate ferredoxin oxidoreductase family protein [Armatimonadota bacterium]MDR7615506.1 indolepyruvate ferredoxin oxidoreductase family protein [Armatimonadota bacterium]
MARSLEELRLEDRYTLEEGEVYLTGIQALVRLPLDQVRRDRRAGLRTGVFISGYPGSPLGVYDVALQRVRNLLEAHHVVHRPAPNEESAATALMGTQMLDSYPHSRYDGVVGIWYGKGPGVDRSGDALKHGNFAGTSRYGAVVVLAGEDHEGKSSTMPFQDDYAFLTHGIPVIYPASVAEFLELGLHAIALSRFSGCWVAMKLVAPLCDGGEVVCVHPDRPEIVIPELEIDGKPFRKRTDFTFFPGTNVETERHLYRERHAAVRAYAAVNGLNRIVIDPPRARVGIVTAGKSYTDVRQALADLGLDEETLRGLGIRLLKLGLIYPLELRVLREFARDLEEVIVVEEKRGFVEAQVKEALLDLGRPIKVVGKNDEHGAPLFPLQGAMDADLVAEILAERLKPYLGDHPGVRARTERLRAIRERRYPPARSRMPNYCSGCPHNTSTVLLPGQVAWGSPGCHSFASIIEQPHRHIVAMTQYGGEGLPWLGLQPFVDQPHMVQNVGDGSLFHSSYPNIRFSASVGANITFKILYNGYIANTGAQQPVGQVGIPELTRMLEADGVRRIAIVTKDPNRYRNAGLARNVTVYPAHEHERALRDLRQVQGTTVYIYDEMCANERRRQQKRGKLPRPERYVMIHERVCEGCGDCGQVSNCMSLQRVETEFGPKTQVHLSSCNQDYSCLRGDCPSFVTVEAPGGFARPHPPVLGPDAIPEPPGKVRPEGPYHIYMPGVGGTGVLTVSAILSFAAWRDGLRVLSYDQTGAAQKWGAVISSLVLTPGGGQAWSNKVGLGKADLYLVLDLIGGVAPQNLDRCDPLRSVAVVNTTVLPTGEMIRDPFATVSPEVLERTIAQYTRASENVYVEGRRVAEALFGDYMMTNLLMLGVAYQAGRLPLRAESIEWAIRLNGVQVEENLQAFRYGRLLVHAPERVRALVEPPSLPYEEEQIRLERRLGWTGRRAYRALLARCRDLDEESRRMLVIRVGDLMEYQDARYARRYVDFVLRVAARERQIMGHTGPLTHAVIRSLHKLMAYKDEYEVARLYLREEFWEQLRRVFPSARNIRLHLHPPVLRALGLRRKIQVGTWILPVFRLLRALRRLRGTPLDPFGHTRVRREERRLIGWYREVVQRAVQHLRPETYAQVLELLQLPDRIRGYEHVKLRNAEAVRAHATELLRRLVTPAERVPVSADREARGLS